MSLYFCEVPLRIRLAMLRVVSVPNSTVELGDALHQIDAAIGAGRMGVDRGLAAVELLPDRSEGGVAEPLVAVARHDADAVDLQRVEGVGDFLQALVDVRQRQHGEGAEAAGMIGLQFLGVLVRFARDADRRVLAERRHLRRGRRQDRGRDAALVHVFEHLLRRPVRQREILAADHVHRVEPGRRHDMGVHVDAVRFRLREHLRREARGGEPRRGGAGDELPAADAGRGQRLDAARADAPTARGLST